MQKSKRMRVSGADKSRGVVKNLPSGGQERTTNRQNGNKTSGLQKGAQLFVQRKKRRSLRAENNSSEGEKIYSNTKCCVICGNNNEVVDLSSNPIMKRTMASYCQDDGVNLDDCLSSLCIACVFKSRAVEEVQNNIKVRLQGFSNGLMLKSTKRQGFNMGREEYAEGNTAEETIFGINDSNEHSSEMKLSVIKRSNDMSSESIQTSLEQVRIMESCESDSRLCCTASLIPASSTPLSFNHPSRPQRHQPTLSKYIYKNSVLDNSIENSDNKSNVQLANYTLTEISQLSSMHNVDSMNTKYNAEVQTSLYQEGVELVTISNHPSSYTNSTHSQNGINNSMLQVIRERSESVLITESGGKINNYKRTLRPVGPRLCQYCGISYIRKDHYNKHIRRCRTLSIRSVSSLTATIEEKKETVSAKRFRMNGVNNCAPPAAIETSKRTRRFHCTECLATVDSIKELKEHRATHLRKYNCDMCDKKFNTLHEHDFHRIVCLAEKQVWQDQQLDEDQKERHVNNKNKSIVRSERSVTKSVMNCRITRARSRARTDVVEKPAEKPKLTVDEKSDIDAGYTSNDDDDDVSVADSMDSRRRIYTDDWLDQRNVTEIYDLPVMHIDNEKEYDLYLLEKLKSQIKAQEFTCLAENCNFFTDTLLNLMLHDYVHHFKSSWFYCQKCGSVFTSKVFLDYHLDRQNGGRFICYKCNEQFMFQHQLDLHFIAHTKQVNHACGKCNCEFLTEGKLFQHIKLEHNNEIEKKLICIQSKTTFASSRSLDENRYINGREHRKYSVKTLNMHLPRMSSKRPLELPGHKPYRRRIGVIEFENERNPNCCSCK
ncbi:zinc finger protein 432 [Anastrepha ludens]|uniref:zinc finger protein 432 n=1 Tax=Anastrepha ludens TaxID=28586 RepID=UPI0023B1C4FD|nr:zinc finger protein 432 [Anastrepha ludens]